MVFYCVIKVNKKHLEHPLVKNKVGSMYLGLDAKNHYVDTYAPIFLLRRSVFILICFLLSFIANLQIQFTIQLTLLYLAYLFFAKVNESPWHLRLEVMNEVFLILICYHYVVFSLLYYLPTFQYRIGKSLFWLILALIATNTMVILSTITVQVKTSCKIYWAKRHERQKYETMSEKK